jgi:hypothetical protein
MTAKKVLTRRHGFWQQCAVACERFWQKRTRYHLIPIELGAKATVGTLRGGLTGTASAPVPDTKTGSMVLLILI